jgi:hypothetical protein
MLGAGIGPVRRNRVLAVQDLAVKIVALQVPIGGASLAARRFGHFATALAAPSPRALNGDPTVAPSPCARTIGASAGGAGTDYCNRCRERAYCPMLGRRSDSF